MNSLLRVIFRMTQKLLQTLPRDTVLDIKANIGYYILISAKIAGETGKLFSFEPNPAYFSIKKRV